MLPPFDPTILAGRPKFEVLYRDLCANRLKSDGTSVQDEKLRKERDVFEQSFSKASVEAAQRAVIRSQLSKVAWQSDALPDELQELLAVLSAQLDGQVPPEDYDLVQEYVEAFKANPAQIVTLLQRHIIDEASIVAKVIDPHISLADIAPELRNIKSSIATSATKIAQSRLELIDQATALHTLHDQILASAIRLLEQNIHGALPRATKAQAEYLALVAEGMSKKLGVQHAQLLAPLHGSQVQEVLKGRVEDFGREERKFRREAEEMEERLAVYRKGRFDGLARELVELRGECERVEGEVARLKQR